MLRNCRMTYILSYFSDTFVSTQKATSDLRTVRDLSSGPAHGRAGRVGPLLSHLSSFSPTAAPCTGHLLHTWTPYLHI